MRILVVNDDGITAPGILRLAEMAVKFGEVWVVAPDCQCSAMSQRISVRGKISVRKVNFPLSDVHAYAIGGTPADCVKMAVYFLMSEKPDIIFSGINAGYNMGFDILYSGTIGAAMEGLVQGIPAIAFSCAANGVYDVADKYMFSITKQLLEKRLPKNEIWNINFPDCKLEDMKGILWDVAVDQQEFYHDHYAKENETEYGFDLLPQGIPTYEAAEGTDSWAVLNNYIAVGKIKNMIISQRE